MGGKDQPRDSDGKWSGSGMSEGLAGLVENETDAIRHKHPGASDRDLEKIALEAVIHTAVKGEDSRYKMKHATEASRILRTEFKSLSAYVGKLTGGKKAKPNYSEARKIMAAAKAIKKD
jgi:hypothetical protein